MPNAWTIILIFQLSYALRIITLLLYYIVVDILNKHSLTDQSRWFFIVWERVKLIYSYFKDAHIDQFVYLINTTGLYKSMIIFLLMQELVCRAMFNVESVCIKQQIKGVEPFDWRLSWYIVVSCCFNKE